MASRSKLSKKKAHGDDRDLLWPAGETSADHREWRLEDLAPERFKTPPNSRPNWDLDEDPKVTLQRRKEGTDKSTDWLNGSMGSLSEAEQEEDEDREEAIKPAQRKVLRTAHKSHHSARRKKSSTEPSLDSVGVKVAQLSISDNSRRSEEAKSKERAPYIERNTDDEKDRVSVKASKSSSRALVPFNPKHSSHSSRPSGTRPPTAGSSTRTRPPASSRPARSVQTNSPDTGGYRRPIVEVDTLSLISVPSQPALTWYDTKTRDGKSR